MSLSRQSFLSFIDSCWYHPFFSTTAERKGSRAVVAAASSKLVVRNLAFEATKKELTELFSAFGQIKSVRIPVKKYDGSHRG